MEIVENPPKTSKELVAFENECIELFVHAAQVLSVPRSVGEIYGLLYASPHPIHMDYIMERLEMSKGSVSQGLRWLRDLGAVRSQYIPGDRRDHYVAVTELRKLASGFLHERVLPHLRSGEDYLERLDHLAAEVPGEHRKFAKDRMSKVKTWHRVATKIIPLFLRVTGRA